MDMDVEELDKLYDTIESQNIEIIDDLGDASLDVITFDTPDMPKAADPDLSIGSITKCSNGRSCQGLSQRDRPRSPVEQ